eukprot:TRINITY_DN7356_c0_g1_i1.p1 TRINITY_DN7356_c0_g1~~TRINITY_DN7356_c0_g1_i1.p1  ORF type:complete len:259 (+),score=52.81 TRINITY_DN7356_c0_g1_i1:29-805(+)
MDMPDIFALASNPSPPPKEPNTPSQQSPSPPSVSVSPSTRSPVITHQKIEESADDVQMMEESSDSSMNIEEKKEAKSANIPATLSPAPTASTNSNSAYAGMVNSYYGTGAMGGVTDQRMQYGYLYGYPNNVALYPNDNLTDDDYYLPVRKDKIRKLANNFTEDQQKRYEVYKTIAFKKSTVSKIMSPKFDKPTDDTVIVMSGITKIFCAEILEKAKEVMAEAGETGKILPHHIMEAYRLIRKEGKIPYSQPNRRFFRF